MHDAPPYSPNATSSERRLPNDYQFTRVGETEEDPLASLSRAKTNSSTHSTPRATTSHLSPHGNFASSSRPNALTQVVSAPARPTPVHHPELPPSYAPVDELAYTFRLEAPFVYTTRTSNVPRYQLRQEFTRSGKPRRLSIRRLMANETRHASLPSPTLFASGPPRIRYDDDGTMYDITSFEMRGHRASTLAGSIKLESGRELLGPKWTRIYLYRKSARRDSLNPENEARMHKFGYHADDEWDKKLLFQVKKGIWEVGEGRQVAREHEGEFEVVDLGLDGAKRDLLIACWLMKVWNGEGMRWEGDLKGW